jgi:hypothetical protein
MNYRIYSAEPAPPGWGVQAIVHDDPDNGWAMSTGGDYYIRREDRWTAVDLAGMLDHVVNELGVVLVGRTISNVEYRRIYQEAKADRDFARKTGFLPGERRP